MRVEIPVVLELDVNNLDLSIGKLRISGSATRTAFYQGEFEVFHDGTYGEIRLRPEEATRIALNINEFVSRHREVFL